MGKVACAPAIRTAGRRQPSPDRSLALSAVHDVRTAERNRYAAGVDADGNRVLIADDAVGTTLWQASLAVPTGGQITEAVTDGTKVWVGYHTGGTGYDRDGRLSQFDAASGTRDWDQKIDDSYSGTVSALAADGNGSVWAVASQRHSTLRRFAADGSLTTTISHDFAAGVAVAANGDVISASTSLGPVTRYTPNGALVWQEEVRRNPDNDVAIGPDGQVAVASRYDKIVLLEPDGTQRWATGTRAGVDAVDVEFDPDGNVLYVERGRSYVERLDGATGGRIGQVYFESDVVDLGDTPVAIAGP